MCIFLQQIGCNSKKIPYHEHVIYKMQYKEDEFKSNV